MEKNNLDMIIRNEDVRSVWDEEGLRRLYSVVDVVAVLTDQKDRQTARKYWNKLKQRQKTKEMSR
jgi:hypothetical protein